ncbi:MAG: deoxyhypusine synthase [Phycisphaerae bacterium SM23_30]|nr:MAG: deoxyhypusine synthase [Phycisphaerae bacterium SM23_30]
MDKADYLKEYVEHIDIKAFDATGIINQMRKMSFTARETARAADIYLEMLRDEDCTVILCLAGSTGAAGCLQIYADMMAYNLADVVVATGAAIVDMDFFEALGFRHYQGSAEAADGVLRQNYIDRIYDTYIDEQELQVCDMTVKAIADGLERRSYSSREFIREMGRYLTDHAKKKGSLVELAYRHKAPIFCPAFSDSSAGFGLVQHQYENKDHHAGIDAVQDFRELTEIKMRAEVTGLFIVGGGVPKNFAQDTVICAEVLGREVPMHKYAVQITVADVRDGACSSSTLREARSWGKVQEGRQQMVYAEATSVLPLIVSYAYHQGAGRGRKRRAWEAIF